MEYNLRRTMELNVTEEEIRTIKMFSNFLSDYLYDVNNDRMNLCDMVLEMRFFNGDYSEAQRYDLDINIIDKKEN